MKQTPVPDALILTCAAMLTVPTTLLIACCFLSLFEMAGDPQAASSFSGPAWLGTVMFPVPAALLVMAEYRAIRRRDSKAAALIAGVCLWIPVVGSIGWVAGLLSLVGVLPHGHDSQSWADFGIYSAMMSYFAFAGFGHLRWWRALRDSKIIEPAPWDA